MPGAPRTAPPASGSACHDHGDRARPARRSTTPRPTSRRTGTTSSWLRPARTAGWLSPRWRCMVLDREAGEFFLRSRATAFPGTADRRLLRRHFRPAARPHRHQHPEPDRRAAPPGCGRWSGPAFTPRAADRWRPVMRGYLRQLWGDVLPGPDVLPGTPGPDVLPGRCEFMAAVARPYPALTIAAVLGAPAADAPRLQGWSNLVQRQFDIQRPAGRAGRASSGPWSRWAST